MPTQPQRTAQRSGPVRRVQSGAAPAAKAPAPAPVQEPEPQVEQEQEQSADESVVESAGELSFDDLVSEDGTIDLSDVPDRIQQELLPRGRYEAEVEEAEFGTSQRSGRPMLTITWLTQDDDGRDRRVRDRCLTDDMRGLSRIKQTINATLESGEEYDFTRFDPEAMPEWLEGRRAIIQVGISKDRTGEYDDSNNVRSVQPLEAFGE